MSLAPYDMFQLGDLTTMRILGGRPEEAIAMLDRAIAADPSDRAFYQQLRGWALCVAGRHQESSAALAEGIELPAVPFLRAINEVALGRLEEAKKHVEKGKALVPGINIARWRAANFYRDQAVLDKQVEALIAAGL